MLGNGAGVAADVEFRILGEIEFESGGRVRRLGSAKQRALLALLLLHVNEVVSRDVLIDELWGEDAPATAAHSLDVHVSRLRKALGELVETHADVIATQPGGYILRAHPENVDVCRFERLLADGERALRAGHADVAAWKLREALALWRGAALAGLSLEPFAALEAARLEQERLQAHEARIEADLRIGRHEALLPELEALVAKHPTRERLVRLLMLARYRSGRQAEALEAYRHARQTLVEELGIEPGRDLQELEQAILRHDPALAPPAPEPREHPPARLPRAPARRLLSAGRRRAVVVAAVAGFAVAAVAIGIVVVTGDSDPGLAHVDANSVGVVDGDSMRIASEVGTRGAPSRLAAGAGAVWAASAEARSISRIDVRSRSVTQSLTLDGSPGGIAVAARSVWAADTLGETVVRIDPDTNRIVDTVRVGNGPADVAAGAGAVWVTTSGDQSLVRIDARSGRVLARIPTGASGSGLALGGGSVWVADDGGNRVVRVDARTNRATDAVGVGRGPAAVAFGEGSVWVANALDGTVSRIEPGAGVVTDTVRVGGSPNGIAVGGGRVWVADEKGAVVRIDPDRLARVDAAPVGNRPEDVVFANGSAWVAVQAAPAAHAGGTLRILATWGADFDTLDPARAYRAGSWSTLLATNDGLTTFKKIGGDESSRLVPDLAAAIPEPTDRGRSYTFRLRPGIRYSDGRPVRPADFRRALERAYAVGMPVSYYDELVGAAGCLRHPARCDLSHGVVGDDAARTVAFHLVARDLEFPAKLALPFADPVPAGTPPRPLTRPVPATGPYVVSAYVPRRRIVLVRNPRFHEWSRAAQPAGFPDRIVWTIRPTNASFVDAVERGDADWSWDGPPNDRIRELLTRYASQVRFTPQKNTVFLFLNTRIPPFDDVRVRRALNYAVDRRELIRRRGPPLYATPTCQVLPPGFQGYRRYCPYTVSPRPDGAWSGPDLVRARRLVAASGARGERVVVWADGSYPEGKRMGGYIVSVLRRLGFDASLKLYPYGTSLGDSRKRIQTAIAGFWPDYPRASAAFAAQLTCSSFRARSPDNQNYAQFCDPHVDRLVERALALQLRRPEAASALWARVDHLVTDEAPWVPLFTPRVLDFFSARVGNYQLTSWGVPLLSQFWVR